MQKEPIISIDQVTDDSTGVWSVGELEYSIHLGRIIPYMEKHGLKGRNELFAMIGVLTCKVQEYYEQHGFPKDNGPVSSAN